MMTLYQLTAEHQKVIDLLFDSDDTAPEFIDMLDNIDEDIKEKSINICFAIKNMEHLQEGIQKEKEIMQNRLIKIQNKINYLKSYLSTNLSLSGVKKIESQYFDITLRNYNYSLDERDINLTPEKYIKHKTTTSIDKRLIIEDLKQGEEVPGWSFKTTKSICIK